MALKLAVYLSPSLSSNRFQRTQDSAAFLYALVAIVFSMGIHSPTFIILHRPFKTSLQPEYLLILYPLISIHITAHSRGSLTLLCQKQPISFLQCNPMPAVFCFSGPTSH